MKNLISIKYLDQIVPIAEVIDISGNAIGSIHFEDDGTNEPIKLKIDLKSIPSFEAACASVDEALQMIRNLLQPI